MKNEIIWKSVQCKWNHIFTCSRIQKRVQYDLISSSGEWYFHSIGSVVGSKNSWWERAKSHWTLGKDCTLDAYNIRFTYLEQIISVIFKSSTIHEISIMNFYHFQMTWIGVCILTISDRLRIAFLYILTSSKSTVAVFTT